MKATVRQKSPDLLDHCFSSLQTLAPIKFCITVKLASRR